MNSTLANLAYSTPLSLTLAAQSSIGAVAQLLIMVLTVFNLLIFIRALLSWFMPLGRDPGTRLLVTITEPVLAPLREIISRIVPIQGIDFSIIAALVLIQYILIPMLGTIR